MSSALRFAAERHLQQKLPGTKLPYLVHVVPVASEVIAHLPALTKRNVPDKMADSLRRIREQPREIWIVKLADRIANMDAPPYYWTAEKRAEYRAEALVIADALGSAAPVLDSRLRARIAVYPA